MKTSKHLIDHDRLVTLFFVFVIGTLSLWIYNFFNIPDFRWKEGLKFSIFLIGFFSYEWVILSLLSYYLVRTKKKFAETFEKHPQAYFMLISSILGLTYVLIDTIIEKSILIFFRDLVMVALILFAMPLVTENVKKWSKKQNSKTEIGKNSGRGRIKTPIGFSKN